MDLEWKYLLSMDCEREEIQAHVRILERMGVFPIRITQAVMNFNKKISEFDGLEMNSHSRINWLGEGFLSQSVSCIVSVFLSPYKFRKLEWPHTAVHRSNEPNSNMMVSVQLDRILSNHFLRYVIPFIKDPNSQLISCFHAWKSFGLGH